MACARRRWLREGVQRTATRGAARWGRYSPVPPQPGDLLGHTGCASVPLPRGGRLRAPFPWPTALVPAGVCRACCSAPAPDSSGALSSTTFTFTHLLLTALLQECVPQGSPMRWPCRPAVAATVLLAISLSTLGSGMSAAAAPHPLGQFRSWDEAWAALSPYGLTPKNASAPCGSGPTAAAACGVRPGLAAAAAGCARMSACTPCTPTLIPHTQLFNCRTLPFRLCGRNGRPNMGLCIPLAW